jgi:hypothetical protein
MSDGYQTVLRFAHALDSEDYAQAGSLLSDACVYACRGEVYRGPQAIIASYQGNGTAAKAFDSIRYESQVVAETTRRYRIGFIDHIAHAGRHLSFRCEQLIALDESGRIVSIEHLDLPGQMEALAEFKELLADSDSTVHTPGPVDTIDSQS